MLRKSKISKKQLRNIALDSQLFFPDKVLSVEKIINKLGYIQIDTISVVERSHNHILWTRNNNFKNKELNSLVKSRKIFEYWDHAASYLPIKYYKYSLRRKNSFRKQYSHWFESNKKLIKFIKDRIKNEGGLMSKDFETDGDKRTGWWDWKPAKRALEMMFHSGDLVISERRNFQKVYDFKEKFYPDFEDTEVPTDEEFFEYLVMKAIDSFGFASIREILYLRKKDYTILNKVIKKLIEDKRIIEFRVEGSEEIYYSKSSVLNKKYDVINNKEIHILNPFDNLIIQRERTKFLFDFDYVIECYVPSHKRKFGYYVLPVLYGDQFAGRLDAKADRKNGEFLVYNFYPETNFKPGKFFKLQFKENLKKIAEFSGCKKVIYNVGK